MNSLDKMEDYDRLARVAAKLAADLSASQAREAELREKLEAAEARAREAAH